MVNLENLRENYRLKALTEIEAGNSPFFLFEKWMDEAVKADVPEPNAMTLATVSLGQPSARMVLLKGFSYEGFTFYTNYQSRKALELFENGGAALVFFWPLLERQVRVEGLAEKTSDEQSTNYFNSRPKESRAGAIASPQSSVLQSKAELEKLYADLLDDSHHQPLEKPHHWGGYRVVPSLIEFWQGRPGRLHDRIVFKLSSGVWEKFRLAP